MARSKAVEIVFPQLRTTVDKLLIAFPVALGEVEAGRILYIKNDNPKSKKAVKLTAIKVHSSVTPLRFQLTVFPKFEELDEPRQMLNVLRELLRIENFEDSKLGKYPLQDFPEIVEKYGTTWEDREDISMSDVFDKVKVGSTA